MATRSGTDESDVIRGTSANDELYGGGGHDILQGFGGRDHIEGGPGTDFLIGNQGEDLLFGNEDMDILWGGNGVDFIFGGPGDDVIHGGAGSDLLWGGPGRDTFVFSSNHPGVDIIMDFELGDRIDVRSVDGFTAGNAVHEAAPDDDDLFTLNALLAKGLHFPDAFPNAIAAGSVLVYVAGTDPLDAVRPDPAAVAIILNGVFENDVLNNSYMTDWDGGAWIAAGA